MKRRMSALVCVFALVLIAVLGVYFMDSRPILTAQLEEAAGAPRDQLYVMAHFEKDNLLYAAQTFTIANRTGADLSEIVLRVLANGDEYLMLAERAAQIKQVQVGGEDVRFALDQDDPTVLRVQADWKAGETIELFVLSHITVDLAGFASEITLPSLCVYEDGAWRADEWDVLAEATYGPAMDVILRVEYPQEYAIAAGGALVETGKDGGRCISLWTQSGARDVTLSIARAAALRYRRIGGTVVTAMADGAWAANRMLDSAQDALESLEKIGLPYPFPALAVVQTEGEREDGRVYSGLVLLGEEEEDAETRLRRLTRLIARQTFGILVGSDPWKSPWLSQSLASTAELIAYRARKGEDAYQTRFFEEVEIATRLTRPYGVTVGGGVDRFGSDAEMTRVLRDQGAAMLLGIEQAVGADAFMDALSSYVDQKGGQIAVRADFEAALESATGSSWNGYLEDELTY